MQNLQRQKGGLHERIFYKDIQVIHKIIQYSILQMKHNFFLILLGDPGVLCSVPFGEKMYIDRVEQNRVEQSRVEQSRAVQ